MNVLRNDLLRMVAAAEAAFRPTDPWRPKIHLAPPVGWLNDPNGLCCFRGEHHVFYQYTPFDPEGGVKFWGHYKSKDLISWEQCPAMLCPDEPFDVHGAYSGSALRGRPPSYAPCTGAGCAPGGNAHLSLFKYPFSNRPAVNLPELADIQISCEEKLTLKLSGISLKAEGDRLTLAI
nr:hypothetical protein [uncultured Oscillibacter sp.]